MNFDDYQRQAGTTALYPEQDSPVGLMYAALGLGGESGEVQDHVKKMWRDGGVLTDKRIDGIKDELGDVLWYASQVASEAGFTLDEAAAQNLKKLAERARKKEIKEHA